MPVSPALHLRCLLVMARKQIGFPPGPAERLGMFAITAAFRGSQVSPDRMKLAVFAEQMLPAEFGNRDIPNAHAMLLEHAAYAPSAPSTAARISSCRSASSLAPLAVT